MPGHSSKIWEPRWTGAFVPREDANVDLAVLKFKKVKIRRTVLSYNAGNLFLTFSGSGGTGG
ncbi:MAG: hypothetical protein A3J28_04765 [Acidobacteria bacterium RIFCSPLOWO2_12_FULL_60_22]|nr:MAG: hypothetical protein A3J28_04765 [Acidobacteria bacterium RIFCSPLOWO2_12_FULL_60_22]